MDDGPGWRPDPEGSDQERYWNGSGWTDRVRPAGRGRSSLHLPEHVPELQRALAAAAVDIDSVEDRLATLFERAETDGKTEVTTGSGPSLGTPTSEVDLVDELIEVLAGQKAGAEDLEEDPIHEEFADGSFAELDAALASETADESEEPAKVKRGFLRRRG